MIMLDHRCVTQLEHPGHSGVTRKPLREDRLEEMKPAPTKPAISIAVVNQVDARVGTIESVSDVEGSNKQMMGEVSEGMLFDIGYEDDLQPALLTPERPVPNGTRAG